MKMEEPKGKELSINTEEGTLVEQEITEEPKKEKMSIARLLEGLSLGVAGGTVTKKQAKQIRTEFGISQAYFTRKQSTPSQRKKKRKAEKLARRANRGNTKGQKNTKGQNFRINNSAA